MAARLLARYPSAMSPRVSLPPKRVAYIVHDLTDAAVTRRRLQLEATGATVSMAGFRRGPLDGRAIDLGLTADGELGRRALAVLRSVVRADRLAEIVDDADLVVARSLEALIVAVAALGRRPTPLVYECLDVHRSLVGQGPRARLMRAVERLFAARAAGIVTSSPGFVRNHFVPHRLAPPDRIFLSENRLNAALAAVPQARASAPPWRIGWFGILRCRRSLHVLAEAAATLGGALEVVLRGRPSLAAVPDFHDVVAASPYLSYDGPYRYPADLPALYADVHLAWAIDDYEEGANSEWLLPNRLYEAGACGVPHLVRPGTEVASWLGRHGLGVVLTEPDAAGLAATIRTLGADRYAALRRAYDEADRALFVVPPAVAATPFLAAAAGERRARARRGCDVSREG